MGKYNDHIWHAPLQPTSFNSNKKNSYYWNFKIPFYKSVKITGFLPPGATKNDDNYTIYSIVRGEENVPIVIDGVALPKGARMKTHRLQGLSVPSLGFIPLVNLTSGSGVIVGSTLAISGNP